MVSGGVTDTTVYGVLPMIIECPTMSAVQAPPLMRVTPVPNVRQLPPMVSPPVVLPVSPPPVSVTRNVIDVDPSQLPSGTPSMHPVLVFRLCPQGKLPETME
jgi:hypothetical protein